LLLTKGIPQTVGTDPIANPRAAENPLPDTAVCFFPREQLLRGKIAGPAAFFIIPIHFLLCSAPAAAIVGAGGTNIVGPTVQKDDPFRFFNQHLPNVEHVLHKFTAVSSASEKLEAKSMMGP
jgi:hypothetical protein